MSFEYIPLKNQDRNNQKEIKAAKKNKKEKTISRRNFLKGAIGSAIATTSLGTLYEIFNNHDKKTEKATNIPMPIPIENEEKKKRQKLSQKETITIENALDFDSNQDIILDQKFIDQLKENYFQLYKEDGEEHDKIIKAYNNMQKIGLNNLEQHFTNEGLPKDLAYLAIIESTGGTDKRIHKRPKGSSSPVGWYQIAKNAGIKWGELTINNKKDERINPIKSAIACAKIIKKSLAICNNDLDLAIAGYNGGLVWRYVQKTPLSERSYLNFLNKIQNHLNYYKKILKEQNEYNYLVKKGDTISNIARKFDLKSTHHLMKYNELKHPDNIYPEQKIKIPLETQSQKKEIFNSLFRSDGVLENINYVAQVDAVREIINIGIE